MRAAIITAALCACIAMDASAQYSGGRHRSGSGDSSQSDSKKSPIVPDDPFSAIERELPSLTVDIRLTSSQVDAWNVFQRDVRDIAEMDRARRRHVMAMREGGDAPPTAVTLVAALAEDDRMRADATGELQRDLGALYAMLSDAQKRVLDQRLILSQTEPLGK